MSDDRCPVCRAPLLTELSTGERACSDPNCEFDESAWLDRMWRLYIEHLTKRKKRHRMPTWPAQGPDNE